MRYGFDVVVTAVVVVTVTVVSVTGAWSFSFGSRGAAVPSTPEFGSGAAAGIPFCDGV